MTPFPKVASIPLIWFSAAIKYVRNRVRSLSLSSRESQAILYSAWLSFSWILFILPAQSPTRVVLPKPAGAETRITLQCKPWFNCSISRGRETSSGRIVGINSFVARSSSTFRPDPLSLKPNKLCVIQDKTIAQYFLLLPYRNKIALRNIESCFPPHHYSMVDFFTFLPSI